MFHGLFWLLCGVALGVHGVTRGGWAWLWLWPAGSLVLIGAAYLGAGPIVFGKQADGRLHPLALIALAPFLALTWGVWHLGRWLRRRAQCHEVAPGLWLGRRPLPRELPEGVTLVVDMTAEFPGTNPLPSSMRYLAFPTLDAGVPSRERFAAAVECIVASTGPVYLHCAAGRGRSALVAAAVLIARGIAPDATAAVAHLSAARPGIRINRRQLDALARWIESRGLHSQ